MSKNVFLTDRLKNVYFLSLFSLALPFTILSEEKKRERGSDYGIYCDHTGSEPGAMSGKAGGPALGTGKSGPGSR